MGLQDIEIRIRTRVEGLESTKALQTALKSAQGFADTVWKNAGIVDKSANQQRRSLTGLAQVVQNVEREMDGMFRAGYRLQMLGENMTRMGKNLIRSVIGSANAYGDFEMKLRRAGLAVEIGAEKQRWLQQAIEGTAQELRLFNPEEVAEGLYFYGSAVGATVKNQQQLDAALEDTRTVMFAASATNANFEESIKSVYSIFTTYKTGMNKAERATWSMTDITKKMMVVANKTGNEFSDLNTAMIYAAGAATQIGEDFDTTLVTLGLLGDLGQRGSRAGRGLAMAYERLVAPTLKGEQALNKLAQRIGNVNDNFKDMMFPTGEFIGTEKAVWKLSQAMMGMNKVQRAQYVASIFTQNSARVMTPLIEAQIAEMKKANSEHREAKSIYDEEKYSLADYIAYYEKAEKSFKETWRGVTGLLRNSVLPIIYRVGEQTVKSLTPVVAFVSGLLQKFTLWLDENPQIVESFVNITGAMGVFLVVGGTIVSTLGSIMFALAGFKLLANVFGYLGISLKSVVLGPARLVLKTLQFFPGVIKAIAFAFNLLKIAVLTNPFIAIGVAIAGVLVFLYAWGENIGGIREKTAEAFEWLTTEGVRLLDEFVTTVLTVGGEFLGKLLDGIITGLPALITGAMDGLGQLALSIGTWITDNGPMLWEQGLSFIGKLADGMNEALFGTKHRQEGIVTKLGTWFSTELVPWLQANGPMLISEGAKFIGNLIVGVTDFFWGSGGIVAKLAGWFTGVLIPWIGTNGPGLWAGAQALAGQLVSGFIDFIYGPEGIVAKLGAWFDTNVLGFFEAKKGPFGEVGKSPAQALVDGFVSFFMGPEGIITQLQSWFDNDVLGFFEGQKGPFGEVGKSPAQALVDGFIGFFMGPEGIVTKLTTWWDTELIPWFTTNGPLLFEEGRKFVEQLVTGVIDFMYGEEGVVIKLRAWYDEEFVPWFAEVGPKLLAEGEAFAKNLVEGYMDYILGPEGVITKITTWFNKDFVKWFGDTAPKFFEEAGKLAGGLINGFNDFFFGEGSIIDGLLDWFNGGGAGGAGGSMTSTMDDFGADLLKMGGDIASDLFNGFCDVIFGKNGNPGLLQTLSDWFTKTFLPGFIPWAVSLGVKWLELGLKMVNALLDVVLGRNGQKGLLSMLADFVTGTLVPGIQAFAADIIPKAVALGKQLVGSIINGVGQMAQGLLDAGANIAGDLIDGIKDFYNKHRPSIDFSIDIPPLRIPDGVIGGGTVFWDGGRVFDFHSKLPALATGAWDIPYDQMPALLHRGEMVIPRTFAQDLRAASSQGFSFSTANTKRIDVNVKVTSPDGSLDQLGSDKLARALQGSDLISALSHMASVNS